MSEDNIQQRIAEVSKAPRVTEKDVEAAIVSTSYFTAWDGSSTERACIHGSGYEPGTSVVEPPSQALQLLTFCVLVLSNGFTCTGQSACASPENYDEEVGRSIARRNAVSEAWKLLGFDLRTRLAEEKLHYRSMAFGNGDPDMVTYVGTKVLNAKPMTKGEYNAFRGWQQPVGEDAYEEGYLVEYTDRVENLVPFYLGYVSWSPKASFEAAYRPLGKLGGMFTYGRE